MRVRIQRLAGWAAFLILTLAAFPSTGAPETIRVAAIYAQTGPAAPFGLSSLGGVRLAVKEINAAGGVMGRILELKEIDNASTPIGSKVAADSAATYNATAIIGPAYSSNALATAKVAQAEQIPMITSIATHPAITTVGDYIFRVCINDQIQGEAMGRFARQELNAKWVVIVVDLDSDYSIGLAGAFADRFTRMGGRVLANLTYKPNQSHFRDLVTTALSEDPDVIFIPGHFESARIADQAIQRGLRAMLLGGDSWDHDTFFSKGGYRIKLGYFTTHWHKGIETRRSRHFVEKYGAVEKSATAAALAYDAVYLLADAIRRAGSLQRRAIRDALAGTQDFTGVTGPLSFDRNGDPINKSIVIMQINDGRPSYYTQVAPVRTAQ